MGVAAILQAIDRMRENLLYSRHDLAARDRIRRIQDVIAEGETTTDAILRAEFGGDKINGLDIKGYPVRPVKIVPLEQAAYVQDMSARERTRYLRNVAGSAGHGADINLKQVYIDILAEPYRLRRATLPYMAAKTSIVSHENTHRLQYAAVYEGWMGGSTYTSERLILYNLHGNGSLHKMMNAVFKAAQSVMDFAVKMKEGHKVSNYYVEGVEIQARMHEIMVAGYAQWGRLPANKIELQAALYNAGIKMPLRVDWALASHPEGQQALRDFRCSARVAEIVAHPVSGINKAIDFALLPARRAHVWDVVFPQQYGHLIEMYGDGPGRARMGLGPNPAPVIAAAAVVAGDTLLDADRAAALAAAVPPEWANQFFNRMTHGKEFTHNQHVMAAALLARPETRQNIVEKQLADDARLLDDPALPKAIYCGNAQAVEMLLAAGYDPLRRVPNKWLSGHVAQSGNVLNFIDSIRYLESCIARSEAGLSGKFNDESYRKQMRENLSRLDHGLCGVVRYYGDRWMETAPPELHGGIATIRDRMADAARRESEAAVSAPAAVIAAGAP